MSYVNNMSHGSNMSYVNDINNDLKSNILFFTIFIL